MQILQEHLFKQPGRQRLKSPLLCSDSKARLKLRVSLREQAEDVVPTLGDTHLQCHHCPVGFANPHTMSKCY